MLLETGAPGIFPSQPAHAPSGEAESEDVDEEAGEQGGEGAAGPPCPKCGGVLALIAGQDHQLSATCGDCEAEFTYILETDRERGVGTRERRERAPRDEGEGAPRARPCRRCGAPLRFSTNEDGTITGTCDSCGNEFTLPPRRTGGWPERRGGGYPRGDRRGPPRGGGWKPGGGRPRRFDRPQGRGGPPRRRRPRRDEDSE